MANRSGMQDMLDALPQHVQANLARLVRGGTLADLDQQIASWKRMLADMRLGLRMAGSQKQRQDRREEIAAARERIRNLQAKRRRRTSGPRR